MSVTRINDFRAKEGKADALRAFLGQVVPSIRIVAGLPVVQAASEPGQPTPIRSP